jgi:hypothetical protein
MSPKERVLSVFNGRQQAYPLDIGSCAVTGLPIELARQIEPGADLLWADEIANFAHLEAETAVHLNSDIVRAGFVFERPPLQRDEARTDRFGITWANFDGQPTTIAHPFEHLTIREILHQPQPDPNRLTIAAPTTNTDRAVMCDLPVSSIFEQANRLRGYGKLQEDFVDNPRVVSALLDYVLETAVSHYNNLLTRLPVKPDLVLVAEDLGYQNGLAISPELYRVFIKPRQQRLIRTIKRQTDAKIVFHSCGALVPILKDLCQLEVDALHLQPDANGMHPARLRQILPGDMVLYGMLPAAGVLEGGDSTSFGTRGNESLTALRQYLQTCQPVIAGPTDLMMNSSHLLPGITKLTQVIKQANEYL